MTSVAWWPQEDLGLAEWVAHGRRIGLMGRSAGWWIGDWLRYGNARFGEKYSRAARVTGYDVQTLMNMAYVASRFEISRRREILTWSHHAELAALDFETQEYWLERAAPERLSVRDLRLELRSIRNSSEHGKGQRREASRSTRPATQVDTHESVMCPNCGHRFELGAGSALTHT